MPTIRPITLADRKELQEHLARVRAESGQGGELPFTPTTAADRIDPNKLDIDAFARPLTEPKWRRGFVLVKEDGRMVGFVDLKGDELRAGLHRCELGIGIERPYRGAGFGRRLMENAIEFARTAGTIEWIDLYVFAHNSAARALYEKLGFREGRTVPDRFRIDGCTIDDVLMTLAVRN